MKKKGIMLIFTLIFFLCFLRMFFALDSNQGSLANTFIPQPIRINSPANITYNFAIGDNYTLPLNASSGFSLSSWNYKLIGVKSGWIKSGNISINGTSSASVLGSFDAYRWSNQLTVYGTDVNGQVHNNSVVFFVKIPNSAPLIENISENIYVCENNYLNYFFNCYDVDEEGLSVDISPKSPFYIYPFMYSEPTTLVAEIYSGILKKNKVGIYEETVSVSDGQYSDFKKINITVIEINNAPVMQNIGVQTIWLVGDNAIFNKTVQVSDTEDGDQNLGKLNFSISFAGDELFNITSDGKMYFESNETYLGVHNISVCAQDNGIENIHPNISLCSQNGSSIKVCQNFSLTITNENRAPTIVSHSPAILDFNASGSSILSFSITKYDPDGTIPDSYWYLDNKLVAYYSGNSTDSFNYTFACGTGGSHRIRVDITDGVLNDSLTWNLYVVMNSCPIIFPGGGGGGGGGISCIPQLACKEWAVCQNSKKSLESGLISGEDYRTIKELCSKDNYNEDNCGIQLRVCSDLKNCTKFIQRKEILNKCFFSVNPSCFDGIKNCHDEGCEVLVDCGGPCSICSTCSDGIQNQEEEGVDCGGPCPISCLTKISEKPSGFYSFIENNGTVISFGTLILLVIASIIYLLRKIFLIKKEKKRLIYKYLKRKND